VLQVLRSLRGLRVQLLLWTILPLTFVLVAVAVIGISTHQRSMREMVEELDARSARLAAAHLSDSLAERSAWLETMTASQALTPGDALDTFFDGGVARFDATGKLVEALPSFEVWRDRPVSQVLNQRPSENSIATVVFSSIFVDPSSGYDSVLMGLVSENEELLVGAVSLERLGLTEAVVQARATRVEDLDPLRVEDVAQRSYSLITDGAITFLVDSQGRIIHHPNPELIGQQLAEHEGVQAVIQGQTGATYHREQDGRELVVGYAPVAGPSWGLIVQEPWEGLIAPIMRVSLLAPLAVVAAAVVSGLAVTFGLHYVIRPLQALDRQATRVAWGDFSAVDEPVSGVQEIEDLRRTLAGMANQIQRYQSGMRDYIASVTAAQEEERKRLARELHDETIQSLIALGHRIEMVQKALGRDPEQARRRLTELSQLAADTQQEVRRFSRALRPLYLEDLGFVPALEMLAQETEREHDLSVSVELEGPIRRLAPDLELTAYRIAQEGLNNVVRHARAQQAWLIITFTANELVLNIQDDGRGFSPPVNPAELAHEGHFGLMGLHERALLFGGRLQVCSKPGEGTVLEVCLPLADVSI
jgi:signal transduction histidine kinase